MTDPGARVFYEFSGFRLDPQQRLLTSSAEGRPVPLPPKAFETLLYFVERRGELLEKTTLIKAIWPNIIVEENSLNQNISVIRRALCESPGEHRFIVTEPGRGYRFVADVGVVTGQSSPSARTQPAVPTSIAPASQTTFEPRKSIAVLAFTNLTGDPAKEYFSDGMAEELIHRLARIPGVKVPSRTSCFSYKGRSADVRRIARDLQISTVLEGSVRSAGERIRVTAQLIDGSNGYHIWSQHYDRDFDGLFKLQDELAQAIVEALRISMGTSDGDRSLHLPPTRSLEAYHLYLQAMTGQTRPPFTDSLPRALRLLERAVELDPQFAKAHNAIASLHAVAITVDVQLPGTLAELESKIVRGLAMDTDLGPTRVAMGVIYAVQGRWLSAREQFDQGIALDESDPAPLETYGMNLLGTVGSLQRYRDVSLQAHRLAPMWIISVIHLAVAYVLLGDTAPAAQYAAHAADMGFLPHLAPLQDVLAQIALREGRYDEAADLALAGLPPALASDRGTEILREVFRVLRSRANAQPCIEALDALRSRALGLDAGQILRRRFLLWFAQLGALDQAFEILTQSLDQFARKGSIGASWAFLWMPELLDFRRDPRFQLICRRMGLFEYWNVYGPPDNCELKDGKLICH